jgi:hypothetical protein
MADAIGLSATAPVVPAVDRRRVAAAWMAETIALVAGLALILFAVMADRAWFDQHYLPHLFFQRRQQLLWWTVERGLALLIGMALVLPGRRHVGRAFRAGRGADLMITAALSAVAILLAFLVSEFVLRTADWARLDRWALSEEPLRRADPVLGWTNIPARIGIDPFGAGTSRYVIDGHGRRVADLHHPIDPSRPSILFAGESIMFGFRLNWQDTAAARIEAATGLQSVNVAVNGYGTDQALMRLRQELPALKRPVAVIVLFAPALLERSLDPHRPHLDASLRWHPAQPGWRLERVFKNVLLYHSTERIDSAVVMARSSLIGIVAEARGRGAEPLILVPEFAPERPAERRLRERVLAGLPSVRVQLDPRWSVPGDGHPDARGNDALAKAILSALAPRLPHKGTH